MTIPEKQKTVSDKAIEVSVELLAVAGQLLFLFGLASKSWVVALSGFALVYVVFAFGEHIIFPWVRNDD
jgi:hypothetical protein